MEKVSIVMLTYNAPRYIKHTLNTLAKTNGNYELIVFDNDSKEKTKKLLNKYKKIGKIDKLVFSNKNLLFAGGNNEAVKYASEDSKYILLLNSDVEIRNRSWLEKMMNIHKLGVTACQVCSYDDNRPDGWCLLVDKDLYLRYQLNSKKFTWFYSISDFCSRLQNDGYSIQTIEYYNNFIYHFGGSSEINPKYISNCPFNINNLFKHKCEIVNKINVYENDKIARNYFFYLYNFFEKIKKKLKRILRS
ncbi:MULTISPECIES: glycosyltransferase family 2 protein [Coprobacillaceae]|uniref:glycosyltransferase family 2 protein n=1 Tax=Coprobacillaceae TaxID=2810280 RepID=UPI000E4AFC65|nr:MULTISPECIES: glycosyltransferase [Coprobacillaceae]RHM62807.1 glycosyltransferase [Coprobacillus sp. AF33-1AC]RHS96104.1 glycosyltransferase [Erysipelatoclostridium sp. AM42-17]